MKKTGHRYTSHRRVSDDDQTVQHAYPVDTFCSCETCVHEDSVCAQPYCLQHGELRATFNTDMLIRKQVATNDLGNEVNTLATRTHVNACMHSTASTHTHAQVVEDEEVVPEEVVEAEEAPVEQKEAEEEEAAPVLVRAESDGLEALQCTFAHGGEMCSVLQSRNMAGWRREPSSCARMLSSSALFHVGTVKTRAPARLAPCLPATAVQT